ncbi:hypothetical protein BHM03_00049729 [Ensete ventricosum]|nr:hypothetical protein BHM03_00049729 [Ensete ventricosum]
MATSLAGVTGHDQATCKGACDCDQGPLQGGGWFRLGPTAREAGCSTITTREANDAYRRGSRPCVGQPLGANNARRLTDQVVA